MNVYTSDRLLQEKEDQEEEDKKIYFTQLGWHMTQIENKINTLTSAKNENYSN